MVSKLGEFDIALMEDGFKVEASSPNAVCLVRQQRNVAEEAVVNSANKVNSKEFKETAG